MGGLADVIIGAIFGARFGFRFFRIKIILFPLSPLTVLRYCPASDVYHLCWDSVLVFSDYRAKKMQCSCMKTDFELASVFVDRVQLIGARSRSNFAGPTDDALETEKSSYHKVKTVYRPLSVRTHICAFECGQIGRTLSRRDSGEAAAASLILVSSRLASRSPAPCSVADGTTLSRVRRDK